MEDIGLRVKPGKAGVQLNPDIPADFLQPPDGGEFRAAGEAGRDHAEFLSRLAERGEFIEHRTDAGKPHKGHEKVNPVRGLDFGLQFMKEIRGSPVRIGDQRRVRDGGGRRDPLSSEGRAVLLAGLQGARRP